MRRWSSQSSAGMGWNKVQPSVLWKVRTGSVSERGRTTSSGFQKFGGKWPQGRGCLRNRMHLENERAGAGLTGAGLVKLANTYWMLSVWGQGAKSLFISFSPSHNISDVDSSSSLREESNVERLSKPPKITKTVSGRVGTLASKAMRNQYWTGPLLYYCTVSLKNASTF